METFIVFALGGATVYFIIYPEKFKQLLAIFKSPDKPKAP
jgi:hypothetical protein